MPDIRRIIALDPQTQEAELSVGEEFDLTVAENPTTGYRWEFTFSPGLHVIDQFFVLPEGAAIGGGGRRVLRICAEGEGRQRVDAKHWRFWEGEASVTERRSLQLLVKGG